MSIIKRLFFVFFISLVLCWSNAAIAATIHVPSDYATIHEAITAAENGDTVLVADGTYTDTELTWTGKHIALVSESGDPTACIIQGDNTGSVFYFDETGQTAADVINGFTITAGYTLGYGGGIYLYYSSPTITNCIFTNNYANYGGGISCDESSPTITNCTFTNNDSNYYGGGIYVDEASPTITGCTFTNSDSNNYGGAIYIYDSSATITNCIIGEEGNGNSSEYGGGIYISGGESKDIGGKTIADEVYSYPTIIGCTFTDNGAEYGGGIYIAEDSSPTITTCTFEDNGAQSGGGIYVNEYSSATIATCTFEDNGAQSGGGIYCDYEASPTITDCTFKRDHAQYGGGIDSYESTPTITGCTFTRDRAEYGAGIYSYESTPTITGCTFTRGRAYEGAGINSYKDYDMSIINCTIADNYVGEDGAGIYAYDSYIEVTNCTIADNYADDEGGGIYGDGCFVEVKNSVLWGNYDDYDDVDYQIYLYDSSSLTVDYSDVEYGPLDGIYVDGSTPPEFWANRYNIVSDPLFVNPYGKVASLKEDTEEGKECYESYDYHLTKESPCIDVGTNDGAPDNDIDKQVRPFNDVVDMGSDEYTWSSSVDVVGGSATLDLDTGALTEETVISDTDLPDTGKPDLTFPFGLLSFRIIDIAPGDTVIVALTLPDNVPTDAQYWKYGPTSESLGEDTWFQFPFGSNDGDNIITLTLVDGQDGDTDLIANGVIIDPGGIGVPVSTGGGNDNNNNNKHCFIATACYGTPSANEVMTLRHFRDECLLTNPVGTIFVNTYYKVSPPMADFIREHPMLRNIVRQTLKPLIWMSEKLIE